MSEARKCDRCKGFYDIAEEQQDRETPYEFKGDYVNLHLWVARNGIRKDVMSQWYDLCPKCMMELESWLKNNEFPTNCEPEDTKEDNETTKKLCYFEYCKCCPSLIWERSLPGETGYSEVRCSRWYTSIPMRGADPKLIDSITPDMFIKEEEYKDPCKSCLNGVCEQCDYGYCSEEEKKKRWLENHKEEVKISDPYEDGGM